MKNINELLKILPHRYPFLMIDKVIKWDKKKSIQAIKNVSINEPYFQGHFPEKPIFPGVLILECMAQASCFLALNIIENRDKKMMLLSTIKTAKFFRIINEIPTVLLILIIFIIIYKPL